MATTTGKLQLQDYDNACVARGFDAYQPAERLQMINFGYRYVARKFPWSWEKTSHNYTLEPGTATIAIQGGLPASAESIRSVFVRSSPQFQKLQPISEPTFLTRWFQQDLTLASARGSSSEYILYENNLYLLPPPQVETVYEVHFYQYLTDMVAPTDVPATPQILDEVILDAALERFHRRAHELQLAADAHIRVTEAIDDMLQSDAFQMEELQDRTLPDDTWL